MGAIRRLISIDPGRRTGFALWEDGKLTYAGTCTPKRLWEQLPSNDHAVIEMPQIYQASRSKGDPNLLSGLLIQCGHVEAIMALYGHTCSMVYPRDWKGQIPKGVSKRRTINALTPEEIAHSSGNAHDMWDAIGLGLWYLKKESLR